MKYVSSAFDSHRLTRCSPCCFFLFRKHNASLCSFCNLEDETVIHLFVHCSKTKRLCCTIIKYFKTDLHIPSLSWQSAFFGFLEANNKVFLILNHVLLLFRYVCFKKFKSSFFWSPLEIRQESLQDGNNLKAIYLNNLKKTIYRNMEHNCAKSVKL